MYHFGANLTSGSRVEEQFFERLDEVLRIIIRTSWWLSSSIKNKLFGVRLYFKPTVGLSNPIAGVPATIISNFRTVVFCLNLIGKLS